MSGAIDLSQLPAPSVVETLDFDSTLEQRKAQLVALFPQDQQDAVKRTLALASDPGEKLLEFSTYGKYCASTHQRSGAGQYAGTGNR